MTIKQYYGYIKYILKHKLEVYKAGRKLGVGRWQLLIHDLSKFSPSEFKAYANRFFNGNPNPEEFDYAWNHHQKYNKHHWQYWVMVDGPNSFKTLEVPEKYLLEMAADWIGVGKTLPTKSTAYQWYDKNRYKILLHPATRYKIETIIMGEEILDKVG